MRCGFRAICLRYLKEKCPMTTGSGPSAHDLSAIQRLELLRRAKAEIARNPRNADAMVTAAGLLGADRDWAAAVAMLQKALSVRKKDRDILMRLVAMALETFDYTLARKYARKLAEAHPRFAQGHRIHGQTLEGGGMPKQAIQAYLRAERLEPGTAETLHDIGRCYGFLGEHDSSIAYFEKALEADPAYSYALYTLANARKFAADEADPYIARIESAIPLTKDPAIRANIHYAAGKVLDDAGRYEEAFDWYEKANEIRRPQEQKPLSPPFTNTRETFTREFFESRNDWGHDSDRPIFILGLPRSGTTLTESICGAHSAVTAGDEIRQMARISTRLGRDSEAQGAFRRNIHNLTAGAIRELAEEYLSETRIISGKTMRFTDKLPHNFLNVGLIALMFPKARIIHCRRHPVANCFSLFSNSMTAFHNRYKTDLTRLGMYYRQYAQLMDHWREVLPGRMHEVYYEDIVTNTGHNSRALISYLGLDWEDNILDRGSQRSVRTLSGWQVRQPVYQSSREKWRHYESRLTPLIEAIGDYVEAYEAELLALNEPDGKEAVA
jgi:tetratricopeptide (TPR) repeat protein